MFTYLEKYLSLSNWVLTRYKIVEMICDIIYLMFIMNLDNIKQPVSMSRGKNKKNH